MADEAFETGVGLGVVRGGSEHLRDSDYEIVKLSVGSNTAKVGMAVTSTAETDPAVDIMATGEIFRGIIVEPVIRPSDTWSPNDALEDGTYVKILKPTGGRVLIKALISGYDTPIAIKTGSYITNVIEAASAVAHASVGALFADTTPAAGTILIGRAAEDFTTGNSTSAANGTWQLMWY